MLDFTLPSVEQIFGSDKVQQLNIFKEYGRYANISDFAITLGGNPNDDINHRTGWYWTHSYKKFIGSYYTSYYVFCISQDGYKKIDVTGNSSVGGRPAISYSALSNYISNEIVNNNNGIVEIEYGEYPQQAVTEDLQKILESLYFDRQLATTGKTYTTDSRNWNEIDIKFTPKTHIEYLYHNKKYVRVKINLFSNEKECILSNGVKYYHGDYVWIEVSPIKWLCDKADNFVISEMILFAGIQFSYKTIYKGNFKNTNIKKFMNTYFAKDIIPSKLSFNKVQNNNITSYINKIIKYNKKNNYLTNDEKTDDSLKYKILTKK